MYKFILHKDTRTKPGQESWVDWPCFDSRKEGEPPKSTYQPGAGEKCPKCHGHIFGPGPPMEAVRIGWHYCNICKKHWSECTLDFYLDGPDEEPMVKDYYVEFIPEEPMHFERTEEGIWLRKTFQCEFCNRIRPYDECYVPERPEKDSIGWRSIVWHIQICTFCKDNRTITENLTKRLSRREREAVQHFCGGESIE